MDIAGNRERIVRYLDEHGVADKDACRPAARRGKAPNIGLKKTRKGLLRKVIDLHGMTADHAEARLYRAMEASAAAGIKELLVIHGWGRHSNPAEGGVLKKMVRDALEHRYTSMVREYKTALPREGGEGATLVTLK
jgi:DNA-nicking Smr family endonuclease